jgi:hypothetical protein
MEEMCGGGELGVRCEIYTRNLDGVVIEVVCERAIDTPAEMNA